MLSSIHSSVEAKKYSPALWVLCSLFISESVTKSFCLFVGLTFSSVQFSHSVASDSLRPHELQHTRPPCSSPTPGVYSNSSSHLILCRPLLLLPSILPSIRVFSSESALCIRWPKYWSFSFNISPSNEEPGLISLGWTGSPCSPRDSQESSPAPQFKSISSSALNLLYSPTLTCIHDHWKNHSLDCTDLCWQSNVSAFSYTV